MFLSFCLCLLAWRCPQTDINQPAARCTNGYALCLSCFYFWYHDYGNDHRPCSILPIIDLLRLWLFVMTLVRLSAPVLNGQGVALILSTIVIWLELNVYLYLDKDTICDCRCVPFILELLVLWDTLWNMTYPFILFKHWRIFQIAAN